MWQSFFNKNKIKQYIKFTHNTAFTITVLTLNLNLFGNQAKVKTKPSPTQLYQMTKKSIVMITVANIDGSTSQGSGVVINNNIITTNAHVVENAKSILVTYNNRMWYVDQIFLSNKIDISFLKIPNLNLPSIPQNTSTEIVGSKIYTIGNPKGLELSFSDGLISSIRNDNNQFFYQITAPISPGSSGGALINSFGELIGITTFKIIGGENLNFAIPINEILNELINANFDTLENIKPNITKKEESPEYLSNYISSTVKYVAQPFIISGNGNQFVVGNNINVNFSPDYRYIILISTGNYSFLNGVRQNLDDSEIRIPIKDVEFKSNKITINYTNSASEGYYDLSAETINGGSSIIISSGGVQYGNKCILLWSRDHEGIIKILSAIKKIQNQVK